MSESEKKKKQNPLSRTIFLQVYDKYLVPVGAWEHRAPVDGR